MKTDRQWVWMPLVGWLLFGFAADAGEVWVLHGVVRGAEHGCAPVYTWSTATVLHNRTASNTSIKVLGYSNGVPVDVSESDLAAGESATLPQPTGGPGAPVYLAHLDVPDGVIPESRLEYQYVSPCQGAPPLPGPAGKTAFPVFRHLVPPLEIQTHYGTDLGLQSAHLNVGVYNASPNWAIALVDVHRPACDTIATTVLAVPPDTLIQRSVDAPAGCSTSVSPRVERYVTYADIRVSAPSLSYATPVSNVQGPTVSFTVATTTSP